MPTVIKKNQQHVIQDIEEPKSAHATPIAQKYVEKRKYKAEKQVSKEQQQMEN